MPAPTTSTRAVALGRPRLTARTAAVVAAVLALAVTLLATAVLAVVTAPPAAAHDSLVSSDPADGAQLATPPAAITLNYSADILATGTQVVVTGPDGGPVDVAAPAVAGPVVTAALPEGLPGGAYTVAWRVVSSDGHPIEGSFGFSVAAQPSPSEPASSASPEPTPLTSPTAVGDADTAAPGEGEAAEDEAAEGDGSRAPWPFLAALAAIIAVAAAAIARNRRQLHQD
jgi:copper resistance protein C